MIFGNSTSLGWFEVLMIFALIMGVMYLARGSSSKILTFIVGLAMVCIAGFRHGYIDTRAYRSGFESLDIRNVLSWDFIFDTNSKDRGFSVLSAIIKIFTQNSQIFLFILALVTVGLLFWGLVKNSEDSFYAIFLFVTTGLYIDTMNGARQALVAAILFFAIPNLIENKKIWKYVLLVLILATIHGSALIFIPIYFIAESKPWSKTTGFIAIVCVIFYLFYNSGVGSFLVSILEGTTYDSDYGEMLLAGNTSVNILRIGIAAVPLAISFFVKDCEETNYGLYKISFNMSLINFFVWLFATRVLYFYRLAIYFTPFMILLLCHEMQLLRNEYNSRVIKHLSYILFFVFFIYSLRNSGEKFFVGYLKY